jgi:hypothetical protein
MNLKTIAKYLRVHWSSFRRNLYGEWSELPRKTIKVAYLDKKGRKKVKSEYEFDLKEVLEYFEKKYNEIKR